MSASPRHHREPALEKPSSITPVRAIILTTQRTGSTFLVACLRSHPEVDCITELLVGAHLEPPAIFRTSRALTKASRFVMAGGWHPTRAIRRFYASSEGRVRVFKAMYNQLSWRPTLNCLRRDRDIRVIHLRRRNLLKMHVSRLLMPTRRNFIWEPHTTEPLPPVRIRVDPAAAIAQMRRARAQYERFEALFAAHPRLPVVYEDLIEDQRLRPAEGRRICGFLGVEERPMSSRFVKLNPDSLEDIVTNYDELLGAVRRTEFAEFLD